MVYLQKNIAIYAKFFWWIMKSRRCHSLTT